MSTPNDGGPAFLGNVDTRLVFSDVGGEIEPAGHKGMSLRDWFAGQALAGLISKLPVVDQTGKLGVVVDDKIAHNDDIAGSVYAIADAMLKARER